MGFLIGAAAQQYLSDLNANQTQLQQAESQVSSGLRLSQPSDDPSAIGDIYEVQSDLAANQQTQNNLQSVQTNLSAADSALQNSISAVNSAISLLSEGMSTMSPQDMTALATQVAGIQQTVVSLSQTSVNGDYIFSGDLSGQPQYQLAPTQPNGVQQQFTTSATQVTLDASGLPIATGLTAQQIFDAQTPTGAPAAGNVFVALNDLHTALVNGNTAGVTTANGELTSALDHLNQQLVFYGQAENQTSNALAMAQKFQLNEQSQLSNVQDANVPAAALELSQAQTEQQATLSVEAKIQQMPTLFNYLG